MTKVGIPLVSVIMATFNDNPTVLKKAVESIIAQTYQNFELFILDDSTSEESKNAVDSFATNPQVHIVRKQKKMGLSGARNVGLKMSLGKYIAIMDADDISVPERFKVQVNFMENHPECSVLGGQMYIIDESDSVISSRRYPLKGYKLKLFATFRNPIAHPTVMFRRELFEKGFQYDETLEMSEDLDLWLRIMNAGYVLENVDEVLINYRIDKSFTDKRSSQKQKNYMAKVRNKNWCNKHVFFSLASSAAGLLFRILPSSSLSSFYNKENSKIQRT